mgnify:CR=1 FL=1|jgi:P pilus assembly chaperone PapD
MFLGAQCVPVFPFFELTTMKLPLFFSLLLYCTLPAQIIVQSGLTHRLETPPGATETVPISLKNVGAVAMDCQLEINDVRSSCDSGYQYLPAGSTDESCALWLELEQEQFLLQPGEEQQIKVRLKCPLSIRKAGARACVLVNSKPAIDSSDSGLKVRVRYAISFLYRNPIIPGLVALHAQRLELSKDQPFWGLRFQNTGNVDRIVRSHAKLIDTSGKVVYSKSSEKARGFAPNQCRTLRFPTPEIPDGSYQMIVVSETDLGERFGVTQKVQWGE